jgi:hypothetical protein
MHPVGGNAPLNRLQPSMTASRSVADAAAVGMLASTKELLSATRLSLATLMRRFKMPRERWKFALADARAFPIMGPAAPQVDVTATRAEEPPAV